MIYTLNGRLTESGENYLIVECGGIGFKIFTINRDAKNAGARGAEVKIFCYLYLREDKIELYGFLEEGALKLFEMLNTVAGVGPKTALGILDVDSLPKVMAAIIEKRAELLTKTSGIGRKTAERIILELQSRIKLPGAKALTEKMDIDTEVAEALVGLGYTRSEVKSAVESLGNEEKNLEGRLRSALKMLGRRRS